MKSDEPLIAGKQGKEVFVGAEVKYQGVPYYMEQMNEWLREFTHKVNDILTQGVTAAGDDAGILFTAGYATGVGQFKEAELNDSRKNGKGYYYMTAGNVAIAEELIKDASLLGSRSSASNGVEECEQIKKMLSMMSDKTQFSFRGRDAGGFLECVLDDAALSAENAETFYSTYLSLETSIDNQRISISGVDEDEEAVSLVKYQNSYDRLILQTGV